MWIRQKISKRILTTLATNIINDLRRQSLLEFSYLQVLVAMAEHDPIKCLANIAEEIVKFRIETLN